MKHLLIILVVFIFVVSLSQLSLVNAQCTSSDTACGSSLDSSLGFGAVSVCGTCYVCGANDGFCPEDFSANGVTPSCSSCPDVDCTVKVNGTVSNSNNQLLSGAELKVKYSGDSTFSVKDTTNSNGFFSSNLMSGSVQVYASYVDTSSGTNELFISPVQNLTLNRSNPQTLNLVVSSATCESDCTRDGSNLCDASCDNNNGCSFPSNANNSINYVKSSLDGKTNGEKVILRTFSSNNSSSDFRDYVSSCVGPIKTEPIIHLPDVINSDSDKLNLITRTIRVHLDDGSLGVLTVVYWN